MERKLYQTGSYRITRFYRDGREAKIIKTGLSLKQAQDHCNDPKTSNIEEGWFDGYTNK